MNNIRMIFNKKRGSHDITNPEDAMDNVYPSGSLNNSILSSARHNNHPAGSMNEGAMGIVNIAMDQEMGEDSIPNQLHHRHHNHIICNHNPSTHNDHVQQQEQTRPVHHMNLLNPSMLNSNHHNHNLNQHLHENAAMRMNGSGTGAPAAGAGTTELSSLRPRSESGSTTASGTAAAAAAGSALQLIWEDVSFKVQIKSWSWPEESVHPYRKVQDKQILQPQSGQVTTGQLIGIIGPSGAGKSTLLNCLTGRYRESHGLTGSVYVTTTPVPLMSPSYATTAAVDSAAASIDASSSSANSCRSIHSESTNNSISASSGDSVLSPDINSSCAAATAAGMAEIPSMLSIEAAAAAASIGGSGIPIPMAGEKSLTQSQVMMATRMRKKLINVAFIPQRDNLFLNFTVKETLVFASKMKNTCYSSGSNIVSDNSRNGMKFSEEDRENPLTTFFDHEKEAIKVMKYLNLESCAKTRISRCSGGQVKRVCIGVELISRPEILVLDEPTTGLDSSTAFQCVSILKTLAGSKVNPPAILATIHQPSAKILMKFNLIYLLSKNGQCLYFGPPDQIKSYFVTAGLEYPIDYNPADFAIETAYGDYGEQVFDTLISVTRRTTSTMLSLNQNSNKHMISKNNNNNNLTENNNVTGAGGGSLMMMRRKSNHSGERIKITTIIKSMESRPYSFLSHVYLLLIRNWMKIYRDSGQLYLRVFQNIVIGLMVSFLWNPDIGHEDGCWSDFLDTGTKAANATDAKVQYLNKIAKINSNSALIFAFLIYVIMVSVMSTVLSFPSETLVIVKEMKNNWYSCASYYWSKMIAEIPILCFMIFILSIIIYPLTGQIPILWRFLILYLVTCMMGEVCQSIGMLFGTIFSNDLISACFSSVASGFPPILFGGFVVQFQNIRWYLRPLAYLSYLRYAFESSVIAIYGFDRCTRKIASSAAENIAKARNPVELIGTLVSSFNLTSKDAQTFSLLLNVDTACVEGVINGTIDYFGINRDAGNSDSTDYSDDADYDGTSTVRPFTLAPTNAQLERMSKKEEASYVLSYFGLKDDLLFSNICALLTFMIVLKVTTYFVLRQKSRI